MSAKHRNVCPQCGYDYEPWIEICPDCGVLLDKVEVADVLPGLQVLRGSLDPNEDPHFTIVMNVPNAIVGNLLKSQLEDAGIPVLMQRATSADIGEFTGNDYVPHVLRVPRDRVDEARLLLDSAPGPGSSAPYWDDIYEDDEEPPAGVRIDPTDLTRLWGEGPASSGGGQGEGEGEGKLPDGWSLLPTERDVRARARHQRFHGELPRGWRWRGEGEGEARRVGPAASARPLYEEDEPGEWWSDPDPDTRYREGSSQAGYSRRHEYDRQRSYEDEWSGSSKWVRIFYGILLLAISLPFLFTLFEQLASIFR